jgi:methionine aminopeptidase
MYEILIHCYIVTFINYNNDSIKNNRRITSDEGECPLVSRTLGMLAKEIKPGITTLYLDKLAHDFIKDHGAEPAFLGYGVFRIVYFSK